jgi:hypothetical protein
MYGCGAHTDS